MAYKHSDLIINVSTYDLCVRAFRTSRKLLKLNIKLHEEEEDVGKASNTGDIFLFNPFNSLYLLKALVLEFAVIKNLKSASGIILYVISLPSRQEPLYFFGGL